MPKCGKCGLDVISTDASVKCSECKAIFHVKCTSLGPSQNATKLKGMVWSCDVCREESKSLAAMKVVKEASTVPEDKRWFLEALNSCKEDITKHVDSSILKLQDTVQSLTEECKALNGKFSQMKADQDSIRQRCADLERDKEQLFGEVRTLRLQLQAADQHSRCANVEISGIPYSPREDVYLVLGQLAKAINVQMRREDFSVAHRLRVYSKKNEHPPIIAQFISRSVKEVWVSAAKKKRGINTTEIAAAFPPGKVYVNDHLTGHNKAVLGRARRLQREGRLHFAGYTNGKILVKPKEGDNSILVSTLEDLDKYDGK